MNTQFFSKFAALTAALVMNGLMLGGTAVLFNAHFDHLSVLAMTNLEAPQAAKTAV